MVRQAASALAALADFTYDRLQDLHIAIDEVASRILATSQPPASRLEFAFEIDGGDLTVTARGDSPVREGGQFLTKWSQTILNSVTDRLEIVSDERIREATGSSGQNLNFAISGTRLNAFLRAHKVEFARGGFFRFPRANADIADDARHWTGVIECWK